MAQAAAACLAVLEVKEVAQLPWLEKRQAEGWVLEACVLWWHSEGWRFAKLPVTFRGQGALL